VLRHELAGFHLADVQAHLASISTRDRVIAVLLMIAGYVSLTGYDALGFRWIGHPLSYPRVALASFVGFVFSHNLGLSFLGGNAVRYRILSSFGVDASAIARVVAFNGLTFWLGFLALGGAVLTIDPLGLPKQLHLPFSTSRPIGVLLLVVLLAWLTYTIVRRTPLRVGGFEIAIPRPRWSFAQIALSAVDWALAAGVLYVLLPSQPQATFATVLGAFLLAQVVALASNVPGGLGVLEGALLLLLGPIFGPGAVLGATVAYRVIYYLVPLVVAVVLFGGYEALQRRAFLRRGGALFGRWLPEVAPRAFAAATAIAGLVLLVSGATPAAADRVSEIARLLPLPVIEASHLVGSIVGVALLVLARALQQRLDAAWYATLAGLAVGALVSLAKGLDWEEAALLGVLFAALLPSRSAFYRRSSLLRESFSAEWTIGIAIALAGTLAITLFAYRHVEYASQLWWRFEIEGHAPRSLRALLGASIALAAFAALRLLRPAPTDEPLPDAAALDRLQPLVAAAPSAEAHLALLGDKRVLLHESGQGFVMYGIEGRTWIAMGDPIGPPEIRRELAWQFRELADAHGARASFYEVAASELPVYLDLGLVLRKLGEEARVSLASFSLEGPRHAKLRHARNRMQREGCRFEVVPAEGVPPLLDEIEAISAEWLAHKNTREKRFSLGCFDRGYLARMPLAVVRHDARIVAFSNLWLGGERDEMSIDLMRYGKQAPPAVMDALFAELMLWGRAEGFAWFSLGMAPLSGFEHHRLAPLWNRFGAMLFRYGEHFYNFQGLRDFKEKFDPVWEPRYLAAPGALAVPLVLTRVASLVNGGVTGTIAR
jgi:phosphatidylglycerol lysyltransferase